MKQELTTSQAIEYMMDNDFHKDYSFFAKLIFNSRAKELITSEEYQSLCSKLELYFEEDIFPKN